MLLFWCIRLLASEVHKMAQELDIVKTEIICKVSAEKPAFNQVLQNGTVVQIL